MSYSGIWHQSVQARERKEEVKREKVGRILEMLRQTLPAPEYDEMIAQWKKGEREFRSENGFIIMCYTPANRA